MASKEGKKDRKEDKNEKQQDNSARLKKGRPGFFSRMFFCWMVPVFYHGTRRDLNEDDLVPAKRIYDSKELGDKLERAWYEEEAKAKAAGRDPSFTKAAFRAFFWSYLPGGLMQLVYISIRTATPLLFSELLTYWSTEETISRETAAYYAAGMIVANWLSAYLNHHGNLYCQQFGMKLRIATSSLMFRKIMRMDNGSLGETTAGKVVNLLSNDLNRFDMAFLFLHYVWIIPLQLAAVLYLGYRQAGVSAFIGIAALIVIALPVQGGLGRVIARVRMRTAEKTDARIKVMSEVINGIQVIKMYAWEVPFENVVIEKRQNELKEIRMANILRTIFLGFMIFTERTALFLTILTFVFLGNTLSATVIYPLQQFLNSAQINITLILPMVLSFTAELIVSIRRIQEYLSVRERADFEQLNKSAAPVATTLFGKALTKSESVKAPVRPLSYQPKQSLTGVMNNGYTPTERNYVRSVSYQSDIVIEVQNVSSSWIGDPNFLALKNLSVRVRRGKLCAVIGAVGSGKSSLLQLLLRELAPGSGTVTVNGSISYASQEAWLFPSTVRENILFGIPYDPAKYKRVCKACALEKDFKQFPYGDQTLVGERGVSLSGGQRARINLARAVYRQADIYLLDDPLSAVDANVGRQLFEGCINGYLRHATRVLVTHQIHFLKAADFIIVLNEGRVENMGTFDELITSGKEFAMMLSSLQEGKDKDADSITSDGSGKIKRHPSMNRSTSIMSEKEQEEDFAPQTIAPEERQSGNLKWNVIASYFKAGGNAVFIITTILLIVATATAAGSVDYWVSFWTNQVANAEEDAGAPIDSGLDVQVGPFTTAQYLIIHGCLVLACFSLTNVRVLPLAHLCVTASKNLHKKMFSTMLRGIMRFFDTSSSAKSPVFGMVTSSLSGIATIRSSGAEKRLITEFDNHQDLHTAAWNGFLGGGAAFGLYLDTLCVIYLATIIFVFLYLDLDGIIPVGSVGLAITQSSTLTMMLQHGARMLVEFLAQLTSVERVLEYTRIETESNLFTGPYVVLDAEAFSEAGLFEGPEGVSHASNMVRDNP
ncbi:hypothetical protein EVAR_31694_1 [Eumeta japonica]|uniref:Multidrug resistance-associated protein lethal(2)03659 n=1 Tax=Eumeta variegata TaxID=151549 RepID=A0A4C1VT99_EUMVA|nr:hypothetical protein EVAR_31694_1 [Eumeta japonica]